GRLGLLIIDEEHRFGVKDKEKLKQLRAEVDVLTLTATPIPRTLNMAMGGLRELSLITTPPAARLSVGHGQMRERELEQVMLDFYHQRSNLLVCTTIVESGIDVPSANTII